MSQPLTAEEVREVLAAVHQLLTPLIAFAEHVQTCARCRLCRLGTQKINAAGDAAVVVQARLAAVAAGGGSPS